MFRTVCLIPFLLLASVASAAPVFVTGNATGSLATATGDLSLVGNTLSLSLTNTSPFDARITGIGIDLFAGGNRGADGIDGFSSTAFGGFTFGANLGNVPQFNSVVLDFGWTSGNSGNFSGGSPNDGLDFSVLAVFTVTGPFAALGLTDAQLANALFVRFQRVGASGQASDVGQAAVGMGQVITAIPEPASTLLLGTGLAGLAVRGYRGARR
jgi:hypothetical protein